MTTQRVEAAESNGGCVMTQRGGRGQGALGPGTQEVASVRGSTWQNKGRTKGPMPVRSEDLGLRI